MAQEIDRIGIELDKAITKLKKLLQDGDESDRLYLARLKATCEDVIAYVSMLETEGKADIIISIHYKWRDEEG
jgi:hypothetical protein